MSLMCFKCTICTCFWHWIRWTPFRLCKRMSMSMFSCFRFRCMPMSMFLYFSLRYSPIGPYSGPPPFRSCPAYLHALISQVGPPSIDQLDAPSDQCVMCHLQIHLWPCEHEYDRRRNVIHDSQCQSVATHTLDMKRCTRADRNPSCSNTFSGNVFTRL